MKLNTAFLLGAGFSYPAGIPIMRELALGFPEILRGEEREVYSGIKELFPKVETDFELLMECCHDLKCIPIPLINRLIERHFGKDFPDLPKWVKGAAGLEERLKGYLRRCCAVQPERAEYLYPWMAWLKQKSCRLDIFTVNYDLLIEGLCEAFFIPCTDGFLLHWQPELFHDPFFRVCVYKLHGSFIWYQSQFGERMKIPVPDGRNGTEDLYRDDLVSMMVYPRRKKQEPFRDLLRIFQERLMTLHRLIVIGYSFRDEEILQIVRDGLKKNHLLHLEIVLPHAEQTGSLFEAAKQVRCFCGGVEEWIRQERYREGDDG